MEHLTRDIATLLGLAAVFGYINHRFLRLPRTIGLVMIAMAASLAALGHGPPAASAIARSGRQLSASRSPS